MKQLKIYGTRRRAHREHWSVKGKGVYKEVRRDRKGRLISVKNWSPKNPINKTVFDETQPIIIDYRTGREALTKARSAIRDWDWISPMKVES